MQTCPHCGNEVEDGLKRCPYCRAKLDVQPTQQDSNNFVNQGYGQEVKFENTSGGREKPDFHTNQQQAGSQSEQAPVWDKRREYDPAPSQSAERPVRHYTEETPYRQPTTEIPRDEAPAQGGPIRPEVFEEDVPKKKKEKKVRVKKEKPKKEAPKKEKRSRKEQKTPMEQAFDKLNEENGENYSSEMYKPNTPKYEETLPESPYEKTLKLVAVLMAVGAVALVAMYYI